MASLLLSSDTKVIMGFAVCGKSPLTRGWFQRILVVKVLFYILLLISLMSTSIFFFNLHFGDCFLLYFAISLKLNILSMMILVATFQEKELI